MSIAEFLNAIINYDGSNLEPVKILLKCNHSLINKVDKGLNPLSTALRNKKCSVELVKLLLRFGANVNYIENNPHIACTFGPLCTALQNIQSIDIIKLLIESWNFRKDACKEHLADMNCIMRCSDSRLKEDIFKLLIEREQDIEVGGLLCKALKYCNEAHDIELLLNAGGALNGCMEHVSPFDCATSFTSSVLLKADVVQILINSGAVMGEATANCFSPLESALFYREYETEAIKLLLDLSDADFNKEKRAYLLHLAVQNASCKTSAVTLLLARGAPVNIPNREWIEGNTELHEALVIEYSQPSIIDILVKSGSDVNAVNGYGDTPLILVAKSFSNPNNSSNQQDIARILLKAGAQIDIGIDCDCFEECKCVAYITLIRVWVFSCVNVCEKAFQCFKLLAHYLFLQCPDMDLDSFLEALCNENFLKEYVEIGCHFSVNSFFQGLNFFKDALLIFIHNYIRELQWMNLVFVADGLTLYEFIDKHALCDNRKEAKYEFDKLLKILSFYSFPLFFEEIASKVDRLTMETGVQKVLIYTIINYPGLPCAKKKVILNYESVCRIASFLSDEDFLKLIVAFHNPNGHVDNDSGRHEIAIRNNERIDGEHNDLAYFIQNFNVIMFPLGHQCMKVKDLSKNFVVRRCLSRIPSFFQKSHY